MKSSSRLPSSTPAGLCAQRSDVVAVVPAAGGGRRLGAAVPKAFVELGGKTLLRRAVDMLLSVGTVGLVVVVVPVERVVDVAAELGSAELVVAGGAQRPHSVRAGLDAALAAAPSARYVVVHDAARALTPPQLVRDVVTALRAGADAVVPVLPVVDTIKTVDTDGLVTGTPDRSTLRAVQTPQGFRVQVLREAHAAGAVATDDAGLVERTGSAVHTIAGDPLAFKITTALDLRLARMLLAEL